MYTTIVYVFKLRIHGDNLQDPLYDKKNVFEKSKINYNLKVYSQFCWLGAI